MTQQHGLCISMKRAQIFDHPKMQSTPPDVDFESDKSPSKSAFWDRPSFAFARCVPSVALLCVIERTVWVSDESGLLAHALFHVVTALPNVFAVHEIYALQYYLRSASSPTVSESSFESCRFSVQGAAILSGSAMDMRGSSQYLSHGSACPSMS